LLHNKDQEHNNSWTASKFHKLPLQADNRSRTVARKSSRGGLYLRGLDIQIWQKCH